MLELRPVCENCNKSLPNDSDEAMICTYECTFCEDCVKNKFYNVCPNCGGGFTKRPTRPSAGLAKYPMKKEPFHRPVNFDAFQDRLDKNKDIDPRMR